MADEAAAAPFASDSSEPESESESESDPESLSLSSLLPDEESEDEPDDELEEDDEDAEDDADEPEDSSSPSTSIFPSTSLFAVLFSSPRSEPEEELSSEEEPESYDWALLLRFRWRRLAGRAGAADDTSAGMTRWFGDWVTTMCLVKSASASRAIQRYQVS